MLNLMDRLFNIWLAVKVGYGNNKKKQDVSNVELVLFFVLSFVLWIIILLLTPLLSSLYWPYLVGS